jgi:hypothetical protein
MPAGIFSVTYAEHHSNTIASGPTVVQVIVKEDGVIGNVKVVRAMAGGFCAPGDKSREQLAI